MNKVDTIEHLLAPFVEVAGMMVGKGMTTERTLQLSHHVGSPHERLSVVHVAGTSGKTSTSYFIRELIERSGKKTGLTVSPHMQSITERVQVSGKPLDEQVFYDYLVEFLERIEDMSFKPSYFELMIVFALWVFTREGVEYAVLETGLGGLHDSTNICRKDDKICVITDIGYDHMNVLGTTLEGIATQKAGIIAKNNLVFMYAQSNEVMRAVKRSVDGAQARLNVVKEDAYVSDYVFTAEYQKRNWNLAYGVVSALANRDEFALPNSVSVAESTTTPVPGRMEKLVVGSTTYILDGAHNEQKMTTFWDSFSKLHPELKPVVVIGMKQGKELHDIVPIVAPRAQSIVATQSSMSQDVPHGPIAASEIEQAFSKVHSDVVCDENLSDALHAAGSKADSVVVTGSLYLVAEARRIILASMV